MESYQQKKKQNRANFKTEINKDREYPVPNHQNHANNFKYGMINSVQLRESKSNQFYSEGYEKINYYTRPHYYEGYDKNNFQKYQAKLVGQMQVDQRFH